MKKLITLVIIIICIVIGVSLAKNHTAVLPASITPPAVTPTVSQQQPQAGAPGTPQKLSIPKLGVQAAIESVGLDSENRMDIPKNVQDVAWYNLGAKPGEKGSTVIDGHLDTQTGAPAVFYYLTKLQSGDAISVTDSTNKTYTYHVTAVTTYPYDQLPLQSIFASTDKTRLNLITCGGTWDKLKKNYSNRTVVYSVME